VSTNSICQGEQAPLLWAELFNKFNIKINFAHRTFKWSNEAKGKAAVHCVIIGFGNSGRNKKLLFYYPKADGMPTETIASNINHYLVDGAIVFIKNRTAPLCDAYKMRYGSIPIDDGHLILSEEDAQYFIKTEPITKKMIRPYYGGNEFINNKKRYCLWLVDITPNEIKQSKLVKKRIEDTKAFRLNSKRIDTNKLANTPSLFGWVSQPESDYLLIPKVSSENRLFIPIGFMKKKNIANGSALIIPNAKQYEFGILTSTMHMAWMRYVCGRMKSDYQYSASFVYNNFPWPNPTGKQKETIEKRAQEVLDTRAKFPNTSLADLYNPTTMPPVLVKAHQKLDKAVEAAYGKPFTADADRVACLFNLYQKMTEGLFAGKTKVKKLKNNNSGI